MKKLSTIIAVILALALLCGAGALAETTITVQGVGAVRVDADRVSISLGVREVASDVMSAQGAVNEKIAKVIDALKDMGVGADAISTNGIGIYPNYSYDSYSDGETITGYTAYNNIYLTLKDVNNSGAYIDAAFAAGANSLDYVEFSAAETDEAAEQALALAVTNASEKAKVLAEAAGLTLGDVLEIREGGDSYYDSTALYAKNESTEADAGTDVLASKQTVSATVTVTFAAGEQ